MKPLNILFGILILPFSIAIGIAELISETRTEFK